MGGRGERRRKGGGRGGSSRSIEARAVIILSATRRTSGAEPTSREKVGVFSNDDDNAVFARLARPPGSSHFRGITNAARSLRGTRH